MVSVISIIKDKKMSDPFPTPELTECEKAQKSVVNLLVLLLRQFGVSDALIDECIVK